MNSAVDAIGDTVLDQLVREALADAETVGLILSGSRGADCARPDSDYDVEWVLHDEAFAARQRRGEPKRGKRTSGTEPPVDLFYTCPQQLGELAATPGWWTPGYITARVLVDKTGEVAAGLHAITAMSPDRAQADAAAWYDAYLNSFYRSLKAWRRNDVFGARLHAAESATHLLRTLFPLEQRWPPYYDRLQPEWGLLAGQGWKDGELQTALLSLLDSGEPLVQIALETRIEALMHARGFGHVLAGWGRDIEAAKTWFLE